MPPEISLLEYFPAIWMEKCRVTDWQIGFVFVDGRYVNPYTWLPGTHPITGLKKHLFIILGKNLEYGLKQEGIITFVRELNGNEIESSYDKYLLDARMYARGKIRNYENIGPVIDRLGLFIWN